jgi:hypothetical protein
MKKIGIINTITALVCSAIFFLIAHCNYFVLKLYNDEGIIVPDRFSSILSFDSIYAFILSAFISSLVFIKDIYLRNSFSVFIDLLIIIFCIFIYICYLQYIDILHIPYAE